MELKLATDDDLALKDKELLAIKSQNDALRETLGKMELALANIVESIVWTDTEGRIKWSNRTFDKLIDQPRLKTLGQPINEVVSFEMDGQCPAKHPCSQLYEERKSVQAEHQLRRGEQVLDLELQGRIFEDRNDELSAVWVIKDITKRKRLENQLLQSRKLKSVGSMAAGIAHEINTPVHYVSENIKFVKESMDDLLKFVDLAANGEASPSDLKEMAESLDLDFLKSEITNAIKESLVGTGRITEIVQSVKEYSHPGNREFERVDINETIRSSTLLTNNEYKYIAKLDLQLEEGTLEVPCLHSEINQVIVNLIINAAHAIDEFRAKHEKSELGTIQITTLKTAVFAEIRITDTGNGIPENIHESIFDPFFTTKTVGKGTGQGLAISHKIITADHKGNLFFETELGRGTTFVIQLPR